MWKLGKRICCNSLHRSSRGAALIEVVIAIVVLGLITSSVPPVLILLNDQQFKWNEQTVAESLVRTQFEYIKGSPYIYGNATVPNPVYTTVPVPSDGYRIDVIVQPIQIDSGTRVHSLLPSGQDKGIQEITVEVYHLDKLVLSVKNYKVDR
jgi:type II secretory pathway pseudopilin PulG